MTDNNPWERHLHARLDRRSQRAPQPPSHHSVTHDPIHLAPKQKETPMFATTLTARSIKVTLVLDAEQTYDALARLQRSDQRVPFTIDVAGRKLSCEFAPKALRKAFNMIDQHGIDAINVMIQGKLLARDQIGEAGLVATIRAKKLEPA
jgi:hypothetical protein